MKITVTYEMTPEEQAQVVDAIAKAQSEQVTHSVHAAMKPLTDNWPQTMQEFWQLFGIQGK